MVTPRVAAQWGERESQTLGRRMRERMTVRIVSLAVRESLLQFAEREREGESTRRGGTAGMGAMCGAACVSPTGRRVRLH